VLNKETRRSGSLLDCPQRLPASPASCVSPVKLLMRFDAIIQHWLQTTQPSGNTNLKRAQSLIRNGDFLVNGESCCDPKHQVLTLAETITTAVNTSGPTPSLSYTRFARATTINPPPTFFYLMNKPRNCVSARTDKSLPTVFNHVPQAYHHPDLSNIGRLDLHTTGTLLFTTDGGILSLLLFPTSKVYKVYRVTLTTPLPDDAEVSVAKGMLLVDDNTQLSPATLHRNPTNPLTCAITVHEGVFHQIKRMMKQLGSEVAALHRERFGEFTVEGLEEGEMRPMTEKEVTR